jgi:hypothetical protein
MWGPVGKHIADERIRRSRGITMGRNKPRPAPQSGKPQGEQQLSDAAWAQIVKTIRELTEGR